LHVRTRPGSSSRSFTSPAGSTEHFIIVEAPPDLDFEAQLDGIEWRYAEARAALGLAPESAIFRRVLVSDAANQAARVRRSRLAGAPDEGPVAVSVVQQPPLPGAKLALFAYHVDGDTGLAKRRLSPRHLLVEKNGLGHLWSTGLCAGNHDPVVSAAGQTQSVFEELIETLAGQGGTLADHCVRTWLYLRDVDVFYQDLVDSRTLLFDRHGLTRDTHYLASTGIEGTCGCRYDVVTMDAYSILGLAPAQVSYLNDFDRLCATKDYDVTFERGTRIAYADRAHHLISGTASIDGAGAVVHPGDVLRQLEHALENVDALLRSAAACLDDMMHLTVYLRDPSDYPRVGGLLRERFGALPTLVVQGPVCRPEWLVEVEGVAVAANDEPSLPNF
jgi:enamine deaminase RidA (YjgF/YER057c/UK114 family)